MQISSITERPEKSRHGAGSGGKYLIVTIICEYKILRFLDSDDFASIKFCDFTKSS